MASAGLLLTGGSSRRMGTDKGLLTLGGETFAVRTARLLAASTRPTLEVGSGISGLDPVPESRPGRGPLAALVEGAAALSARGWQGPILLVATDLPCLTESLLCWLADHPSPRSVVPVKDGHPQPLCARYAWRDVARADSLVRSGCRAMRDLLEVADPLLAPPEEWLPPGLRTDPLTDVDTPEELAVLRSRWGEEAG